MAFGHVETSTVAAIINTDDVANCSGFSMTFLSAEMFLLNLWNTHIVSLYQKLELENPVQFVNLTCKVANMFVELVQGIFDLLPERDKMNSSSLTEMTPCQPYAIASINSYACSTI